jgi:hypothetical protein
VRVVRVHLLVCGASDEAKQSTAEQAKQESARCRLTQRTEATRCEAGNQAHGQQSDTTKRQERRSKNIRTEANLLAGRRWLRRS